MNSFKKKAPEWIHKIISIYITYKLGQTLFMVESVRCNTYFSIYLVEYLTIN